MCMCVYIYIYIHVYMCIYVYIYICFVALTSQNTAMHKKIQNFREYGPGLDIDARILEFLEFFEHYRVS